MQATVELKNLSQIRQRRIDMHKERQAIAAEAKKPTRPLAVKVAEAKKPKVKLVYTVERLERYDVVLGTLERLAIDQPLDAQPLAKALLASLLRLSWARVSGKPATNPDPCDVPHKLFLRQAITKPALKRLQFAIKKNATTSNLLECCKGLLIWLASDPDAVLA
ncbi:hypothetical protein Enr13x_12660 [Stieleria neptunia]|uniref:Uncharacterized protein n=2 Tax=Stieleria neptunia TaxID=2527979 RepID=A0A518HKQ0_9BACT|nr:hypothetical protein Enr13x_12660 [Stieleria neptunia]